MGAALFFIFSPSFDKSALAKTCKRKSALCKSYYTSPLFAKVGDTQVRTSNTDFPYFSALPPKPLTQVFYNF